MASAAKRVAKLNSARHAAPQTAPLSVTLAQLESLVAGSTSCLATAPQVLSVVGRAHAAGYRCEALLSGAGTLLVICHKLSATSAGLQVRAVLNKLHVAVGVANP